jgi:hypothetical protein
MAENIPAYVLQNGQFVYNPNNTAKIPNFKNLPVDPNYRENLAAPGTIVGTSESGQILVRQPDGGASWQPASSKEQHEAATKAIEQIDKFEQEYVRIANNQVVPRSQFDNLDKQDQELLKIKGADALRARQDIAKAEFERRNQQLPDGQWVNREQFKTIDEKYRNVALEKGLSAMARKMETDGIDVNGQDFVFSTGKGFQAPSGGNRPWDIKPIPMTPTDIKQAELKKQYEYQESLPKWKQLLTIQPQVFYDEKSKKYVQVAGGTAMAAGGSVTTIAKLAAALGIGYYTSREVKDVITALKEGKTVSISDGSSATVILPGKRSNELIIGDPRVDFSKYQQESYPLDSDLKVQQEYIPLYPNLTNQIPGYNGEPVQRDMSIYDPKNTVHRDARDHYLSVALAATSTKTSVDWDKALADAESANPQARSNPWEGTQKRTDAATWTDTTQGIREVNEPLKPFVGSQASQKAWAEELSKISAAGEVNLQKEIAILDAVEMAVDAKRYYKEQMIKQYLLSQAWKSYVASLNPTPITGQSNHVMYNTVAAYQLINSIKTSTKLTTATKTKLINQVLNQLKYELRTEPLIQSSVKADTRAETKPETRTETKTDTRTDTRTQAQTRTGVRAATGVATGLANATGVNAATSTATTGANVTNVEAVNVDTMVDTNTLVDNDFTNVRTDTQGRKWARKKAKNEPEDENPRKVKIKPGSVAWEQGKLGKEPHTKEVVVYIEPPYTKKRHLVGIYPEGYDNKGDTPRETIQTIGGPVKKNLRVRIGFEDALVKANEREITFVPNEKSRKRKYNNNFKHSKTIDLGGGIVMDSRGRHLRL